MKLIHNLEKYFDSDYQVSQLPTDKILFFLFYWEEFCSLCDYLNYLKLKKRDQETKDLRNQQIINNVLYIGVIPIGIRPLDWTKSAQFQDERANWHVMEIVVIIDRRPKCHIKGI